ncbi:MAG: fdrA domain protein [Firmicutes bacterium]|nr:fdrA domain protein [Bacillota bacterium]
MSKINELFNDELKIINMGLESFHKDLKSQNVKVIHMNWRPLAGGNKKMASLLSRLK